MKLLNVGEQGEESPAIVDAEGCIRSLEGVCETISPESLKQQGLLALGRLDISRLPIVETGTRIAPAVLNPGKIIAVGLNYDEHIKETGSKRRDEPVLFTKAVSSVSGPNDPIIRPKGATAVDWEIELVVVIGKTSRYVTEEDAESVIAGFCTGIDVSERSFQKNRSGQWLKGKSADSFAPIGPYFVPLDAFKRYQSSALQLSVNGVVRQQSNTDKMIHDVKKIVSYVNEFMSLHPGDLIFTGTPEGVGMGFEPTVYLQAGDTVVGEVEGLGQQCHQVIDYQN